MKKRIIFMGTPDFAAHILQKMFEAEQDYYEIIAVISQPDKPVGRKRVLTATAVKEVALLHNVPILQPAKISEAYEEIKALAPDLLITAAYGQLVPEKILDLPTYRCINVHGSLLPAYRGGAPIHRSIVNGDTETGITIMYMVKRLDAGDMLASRSIPIELDDTLETMYTKLQEVGATLLLEMLPAFFKGEITPVPQNEKAVTYASNIQRAEEKINWEQTNKQIYDHVRGFSPAPATFSTINGTAIKIFAVTMIAGDVKGVKPGTIVYVDKKTCHLATGDGIIALEDIQVSGKKRQKIQEVMNGIGKTLLVEGDCFEE